MKRETTAVRPQTPEVGNDLQEGNIVKLMQKFIENCASELENYTVKVNDVLFFMMKGPAADATDAPKP